jgi:hypothetical protein
MLINEIFFWSTFNILKIISNYLSFFFTRNNELSILQWLHLPLLGARGLKFQDFGISCIMFFQKLAISTILFIGVEFIHVLWYTCVIYGCIWHDMYW